MIKQRVLIVGSNGMLGQRLTEYYLSKPNIEVYCTSNEDESFIKEVEYDKIDLADKKSVKKAINKFFPDVIINAAAYTAVDKCESEKELAWKINVTGVENLIHYAKATDSRIIHVSTDYVFDGEAGPYDETQTPNPISYYGRTKLASENSLKTSGIPHAIIRTNVLYGPAKYGRPDFVKWVVTSLRDGKEINIVDDQINNPTFLDDLVNGIDGLIRFKKSGLYNIGGKEFLDRYEFTLRIAEFFELDQSKIKRIKTADLNQPARRPLKSGLIILKAETEIGYKPHTIEESLQVMKRELGL